MPAWPEKRTWIGSRATRVDGPAKVTGQAQYAGDIRLPGMLYAKLLRPPAHGAKFKSADTSEAKKISGVQVVQDGDFVRAWGERPLDAGVGDIAPTGE